MTGQKPRCGGIRRTDHLYKTVLVGIVDTGDDSVLCIEFDGEDKNKNLWGIILRMDAVTTEKLRAKLGDGRFNFCPWCGTSLDGRTKRNCQDQESLPEGERDPDDFSRYQPV